MDQVKEHVVHEKNKDERRIKLLLLAYKHTQNVVKSHIGFRGGIFKSSAVEL